MKGWVLKAGRITASTILRRLGTYSRTNKLYLAFRELGRVVRTGFLLSYGADRELRATIQTATNKSERLNQFLKWVFFGGAEGHQVQPLGGQLLDFSQPVLVDQAHGPASGGRGKLTAISARLRQPVSYGAYQSIRRLRVEYEPEAATRGL
jgi:hypothetical protein